jgi:hypothetical protein
MSAKGIQAYPNNSYDTELELPASNDAVEGGWHVSCSVQS